jgi:site-specific DNA recombinase
MDSAIFMQKNNEINQQLDLLKRNRRRLVESDADDEMISDCKLLMELMEQGEPYLTNFDEALFHSIVNQIVITEQDKLKFCLIGGFAFTEQLPKEVFGR